MTLNYLITKSKQHSTLTMNIYKNLVSSDNEYIVFVITLENDDSFFYCHETQDLEFEASLTVIFTSEVNSYLYHSKLVSIVPLSKATIETKLQYESMKPCSEFHHVMIDDNIEF